VGRDGHIRTVARAIESAASHHEGCFPVCRIPKRSEGANGRKFLAAIMRPKGVGPFPAVVVLPGGDGLNTSYLSLAPPPKPLTVIRDLDAPVMMMHGTSDSIIPVAQSREYESAARELNKALVAEYFDGVGHKPSLVSESARKRGIEFLQRNLLR
jgi:dienelactone hydrolase